MLSKGELLNIGTCIKSTKQLPMENLTTPADVTVKYIYIAFVAHPAIRHGLKGRKGPVM